MKYLYIFPILLTVVFKHFVHKQTYLLVFIMFKWKNEEINVGKKPFATDLPTEFGNFSETMCLW